MNEASSESAETVRKKTQRRRPKIYGRRSRRRGENRVVISVGDPTLLLPMGDQRIQSLKLPWCVPVLELLFMTSGRPVPRALLSCVSLQ